MRFDLSDEEWVILEPLIPPAWRSRRVDDRRIMNGIFFVLRTGIQAGPARAVRPLYDGL